jgi:glucan phosphoethanolaminetransferase (alkaline phosphatase superfamily)
MANNDANKMTTVMKDKKVILSTLWIFALLNYIYADLFTSFFDPEAQSGTMTMTQGAVLGFAILMEIAIAMVLLSRVLKYGVNRWANIIAGIIHTALVSWSLSVGTQLPFYIFFASIEIACTLFIVWYAWRWRKQEA